jgi:hypothetical protein
MEYRASSRYLSVAAPPRATVGTEFSVIVKISVEPDWQSKLLEEFEVPPEGLLLIAMAPTLEHKTPTQYSVHLPDEGDSKPVRFGFQAPSDGTHVVHIHAFLGAWSVGEVSVQVVAGDAEAPRQQEFGSLYNFAGEEGEVTLVVDGTHDGRHMFHFLGDGFSQTTVAHHNVTAYTRFVEILVQELNDLAREEAGIEAAENQATLLKELGVGLWADAVPHEIREQFWRHRDQIRCFTVLSNHDTIPWELLYPCDYGQGDHGFLLEQFPVFRTTSEKCPPHTLRITSASYVCSPDPTDSVRDELRRVRETLGAEVLDLKDVTTLDQMLAFLQAPTGVLHFAGHNAFTQEDGASIELEGGPFTPTWLRSAARQRTLEAVAPLVFLNACRTAGEIRGLSQPVGWAHQFLAAGASVLVGALWEVSAEAAKEFAVAFYQSFVTDRRPLADAVSIARMAVKSHIGDPTWLAYTVFGRPQDQLAPRDTHPEDSTAGPTPSAPPTNGDDPA